MVKGIHTSLECLREGKTSEDTKNVRTKAIMLLTDGVPSDSGHVKEV